MVFLYRGDVERLSLKYGLDPNLVHAMCLVESGGIRHAWNPEPKYRYLWDVRNKRPFRKVTEEELESKVPPDDFHALLGDADQEWWGQQASWGLMQVMGAVAREFGFQEPYLTQLTESNYGLEFGCTVLASRLNRLGDIDKALGAYNAGLGGATSAAGKRYAAKVVAALEALLA